MKRNVKSNAWTIERLLNSIPVQSQFSSNFLKTWFEMIREAKCCSIPARMIEPTFPPKQRLIPRSNEKKDGEKQTLSLFLHRRGLIPIPGVVKVFAQRVWESFHSVHEEWLENLSSRAESAPGLTRIGSSNQSPLISPDCLITGTRVYGWIGHKDAAKSSFSIDFPSPLSSSPSSFFSRVAIFIGGNRIFFQTPHHADHRTRFDFNWCQPRISQLEMLIPIIRPTIVSGNGLDWVEGTPIPLIRQPTKVSNKRKGEDALSSLEDCLF